MKGKDTKTQWGKVFLLIMFHLGAISALFFASWQMLILGFIAWVVYGFGITIGYHRLLTHRSFKTSRAVEYALTVCGCLALHGGSIRWATTHGEEHHPNSDQPGDPHRPQDGWYWSYMEWVYKRDVNRREPKHLSKYIQRLKKDPVHVWLSKYFWVPSVVLGIILFHFGGYGLGGYVAVAWGIFAPVVSGWHPTWAVNFICHMWGSRQFETPDNSRNNWLIAPITLGEAWHNNHHAKQSAARHGIKWWQFDPSYYMIWFLKLCGQAWAIVPPRLPV